VKETRFGTPLIEAPVSTCALALQTCNPKNLKRLAPRWGLSERSTDRAHRRVLRSCQPRTRRERLFSWRPVESFVVPHPTCPRAVMCQSFRKRACIIFWTRTILARNIRIGPGSDSALNECRNGKGISNVFEKVTVWTPRRGEAVHILPLPAQRYDNVKEKATATDAEADTWHGHDTKCETRPRGSAGQCPICHGGGLCPAIVSDRGTHDAVVSVLGQRERRRASLTRAISKE